MVRLSATHPLNIERLPAVGTSLAHDHDYYEISVILRGSAQHHTADGVQTIGPGTVVVIAPGGVHAFSQPKKMEVINIYYLAEWLAAGWREHWGEQGLVPLFLAQALFRRTDQPRPVVFTLNGRELAATENELQEISEELGSARPSPLFLKAAFLKFLVRLSRASNDRREDMPGAVWAAMHGIEASVENARPFDLISVLKAWPVSADHGSRLFRQATGLSPLEYYQRRRVQHACARLLDGGRTITEVALELGFSDAAHFSRLFRKYAGLTPRDYRRKYTVNAAAPTVA